MTTLADRTIMALRANHDDLAARVGGCGEEIVTLDQIRGAFPGF